MPQKWRSIEDGADAARTVKMIYETTGTLPEELVKSYKKIFNSVKPGVTAAFFEALTKECPEALKFFTKSK